MMNISSLKTMHHLINYLFFILHHLVLFLVYFFLYLNIYFFYLLKSKFDYYQIIFDALIVLYSFDLYNKN